MNKKQKHIDYQDWLLEELTDPETALAYLNEALKDADPKVFLIAIKDVLEAQGGDMTALAAQADLNRQSLYRMLSKKGNPRWDSLKSLFNTLDLQVQLSFKK